MNKKGEIQVVDIRGSIHGTDSSYNPKVECAPNNDNLSMRSSLFDQHNPGYSLQCSYCNTEVIMHAWGLMSRGARCKNCKALYWNGFWWRWKKEE